MTIEKDLIPRIAMVHGCKIVRSIYHSMLHHAMIDADVSNSGVFSINEIYVLSQVVGDISDLELKTELESIFWKLYPAVRDEVKYKKTISWQVVRDQERKMNEEFEKSLAIKKAQPRNDQALSIQH